MTKTITESGLTFGPFADEDCFELEGSATYKSINKTGGIKVCEFALIRRPSDRTPVIWLVEAKSSAPQPGNKEDFDKFIGEIRQKLTNTLQLLVAARLDRHQEAASELPAGFHSLTLQEDWRLVLIINGHMEAWLPPLKDALQAALRPLIKTFALGPKAVMVINEQAASHYGLVA